MSNNDYKRILLRVPNWVGDAVMSLPSIDAIRERFPSSFIAALARPWVSPVVEWHGSVDEVIRYDKSGWGFKDIRQIYRTIIEIKKRRFDAAVLFQNAFEAAFLALLAGIPVRIGYKTDLRGPLLTQPLKVKRRHVHQTLYYLGILEEAGIPAPYREPRIRLPRGLFEEAQRKLIELGIPTEAKILGLGPGAVFGGAKRWPPDRFAEVAKEAHRRWGFHALVFGSDSERGIGDTLCRSFPGAINLCGRTTLTQAMAMIGACRLFLTNDSGLMHVSSALGIPTLAVFGPTDPVETGPLGKHTRIVSVKTSCAPCLKPECPSDHRCMRSVTPGLVLEEMERLIFATGERRYSKNG